MMIFDWRAVNFDLPVLEWIAAHLWNPVLDAIMPIITALGDAGIFWIICSVVMLCIPKYRKAGASMAMALIMGLLLCNMTLKPLVARIRPYDYQLQFFQKNIPLLIEAGADIIHPIQALAAGMEPESLKARFGHKVAFCGGVDTCVGYLRRDENQFQIAGEVGEL